MWVGGDRVGGCWCECVWVGTGWVGVGVSEWGWRGEYGCGW